MNQHVFRVLWVLLALVGLGLFGAQGLIPMVAAEEAYAVPEIAHLVIPYSVMAILAIACVQVALFAIAKLLSMVANDQVFTAAALRWVNTIIGAAVVFCALTLVVTIHVLWRVPGGGGPAFLYLFGVLFAGTIVALLMRVMRQLLVIATANRAELAEVI